MCEIRQESPETLGIPVRAIRVTVPGRKTYPSKHIGCKWTAFKGRESTGIGVL